jgi:hypothetical protein
MQISIKTQVWISLYGSVISEPKKDEMGRACSTHSGGEEFI